MEDLLEVTEWLMNRDYFRICYRNWPPYRTFFKGHSFFLMLEWRKLCSSPITTWFFFSAIKMECLKKETTLIGSKKKKKRTWGERGTGQLFLWKHNVLFIHLWTKGKCASNPNVGSCHSQNVKLTPNEVVTSSFPAQESLTPWSPSRADAPFLQDSQFA